MCFYYTYNVCALMPKNNDKNTFSSCTNPFLSLKFLI